MSCSFAQRHTLTQHPDQHFMFRAFIKIHKEFSSIFTTTLSFRILIKCAQNFCQFQTNTGSFHQFPFGIPRFSSCMSDRQQNFLLYMIPGYLYRSHAKQSYQSVSQFHGDSTISKSSFVIRSYRNIECSFQFQ